MKEKIPTGERYLIYFDRSDNEIINKETTEGSRNKAEGNKESMLEYNDSPIVNVVYQLMEQNQKQQETLQEVYSKLAIYAEQVGQIRLLTDNNKFYQDEYFRLKHELELSEKTCSELVRKIQVIEQESSKLQNELLENNVLLKNMQDENHKLRKEYNKLALELENKSRWAFWK